MKLLLKMAIVMVCFTTPVLVSALEIGDKAPDFTLMSVDGQKVQLSEIKTPIVVLEWFNSECPYVKKHYRNSDMQKLHKEFKDKGIGWILINSTNKAHKSYLNAEESKKLLSDWKLEDYTLLLDPDGRVGRSYGAKTTPHMYIIKDGELVYQGAIDDNSDVFSEPGKSKNFVSQALTEILAGKAVSVPETTSYGCSVKYD